MTLLDELFRFYSFKELVELIINEIGLGSLIILFSAYFAAIVYFSSLPSKGQFSTDFSKSYALSFFQQAFYILSFLIFLMPFISGWGSFILMFLLYVPIFCAMLVNVRVLGRDFSFDDYMELKRDGFKLIVRKARKYYAGIALIWLVVLVELLVFLSCDPSIPLFGWVVVIYSLVAASLQAAFGQGILYNAQHCIYAKIVTAEGIVEGFIVAKDSNHYLVKTKENYIVLSREYVKSIFPSPPSSE